MKVGVVVEGRSEFKALPLLRDQICVVTPATVVKVLHADYDPCASPGRIVRACRSRVLQLVARQYDRVIVLVDREARTESPYMLARNLEAEFERAGLGIPVYVVIKDRKFENWLIADLDALRQLRARFRVTKGMAAKVEPDRADRSDALGLLKDAAKGGAYGKVDDATRILQKAEISKSARHSRSFRCFLARLGHPDFTNGSCARV